MSEDFKNYLDVKMQKVEDENAEVSADAVVENEVEELPTEDDAEPESDDAEEPTEDEVEETDDEPQEVVTEKVNAPKLKANDKGTFHGFFLAPINHLQRITDALNEMAKTDDELAKAIAEGKKTFEGCDRYIRNNMKDLARECGKQEITFDDETVHAIARYYMVNPDNLDAQNVAKSVSNAKEKKPKETKPKAEKKPKKEPKIVPLTPQIGAIKEKEEERKTEQGNKIEKDGQISLF